MGCNSRNDADKRYCLKAPDGTIYTVIGDDAFYDACERIERQFGAKTARLSKPVELVSADELRGMAAAHEQVRSAV